jgi:hypothetical protein
MLGRVGRRLIGLWGLVTRLGWQPKLMRKRLPLRAPSRLDGRVLLISFLWTLKVAELGVF